MKCKSGPGSLGPGQSPAWPATGESLQMPGEGRPAGFSGWISIYACNIMLNLEKNRQTFLLAHFGGEFQLVLVINGQL